MQKKNCKIFWGNLLVVHALGAPTCIISSFEAKKCLPIVLQKELQCLSHSIYLPYYKYLYTELQLNYLNYTMVWPFQCWKKIFKKLLCLCTKGTIMFAVKPQAAPTEFSDTIFLISHKVNKGCWFVEGNQFCSLKFIRLLRVVFSSQQHLRE